MSNLDRVILSNPQVIPFALDDQGKSWIQIARTGNFTSSRYGKFSITKDDLSQMLHNFEHVTPKAPTELPIDFDHLSMDPKKPGDGIAAGWMKGLELRVDGDELWATVEWTPDGGERVRNKEYRFISPSFVKDHVHKDGKKIGTTLLAAAVTNHPFLEGMKAITLSSPSFFDGVECDLATEAPPVSLSEVGQRVMIGPGNARTHDEVGGSFEIHETVGEGDDAFVAVKDVNGVVHKWFRATELLPAAATPQGLPQVPPNLQPGGLPPRIDAVPGAAGGAGAIDPATGQPVAPGTPGAAAPPTNPLATAAAGMDPKDAAANPAIAEAAKTDPAVAEAAAMDPAVAAEAEAQGLDPVTGKPKAKIDPATGLPIPEVDPVTGLPVPVPDQSQTKAGEEDDAAPHPDVSDAVTDEAAANEAHLPFGKKTAVLPWGKKAVPGDPDAGLTEEEKKKKKAKAAALLAAKKGIHMSLFTLRNDKNEEIKVTGEQLKAAGIEVVPDGAVAIPTSDLTEMQGTITNLSERVSSLAAAADKAEQDVRTAKLTAELDRLSSGGYITRPQREFALNTWGEAADLTTFEAWAKSFTKPIVHLNAEHGHGFDRDTETPASKLLSLSQKYVSEGMSARDATIKASLDLPEDSEAYREEFAN